MLFRIPVICHVDIQSRFPGLPIIPPTLQLSVLIVIKDCIGRAFIRHLMFSALDDPVCLRILLPFDFPKQRF